VASEKGKLFFLDEKLKNNNLSIWNYIGQSLLATVTVFLVIHLLGNFTEDAVIVAVVGSTTFVVFAMPDHSTAYPRNVIGGHSVCVLVGILFALILRYVEMDVTIAISGAIGLAIFIMLITDTEHPAAAGSPIPIILSGIAIDLVLFIVASALLLSIARIILKPWLKDLM
jgi:CBS-domain-containing membrane protein